MTKTGQKKMIRRKLSIAPLVRIYNHKTSSREQKTFADSEATRSKAEAIVRVKSNQIMFKE